MQCRIPLIQQAIPWLKNCARNLPVKNMVSTILIHCICHTTSDLLQHVVVLAWKKRHVTRCDAIQWRVGKKKPHIISNLQSALNTDVNQLILIFSTNYLVQLPIKIWWIFLLFPWLVSRSNWCICFSNCPACSLSIYDSCLDHLT